jgi:hypothetical protein
VQLGSSTKRSRCQRSIGCRGVRRRAPRRCRRGRRTSAYAGIRRSNDHSRDGASPAGCGSLAAGCLSTPLTASQFCGRPKHRRSIRRVALCVTSRRRVHPHTHRPDRHGRLATSGQGFLEHIGDGADLSCGPSAARGKCQWAQIDLACRACRCVAWPSGAPTNAGLGTVQLTPFLGTGPKHLQHLTSMIRFYRFYRRDAPKLLNYSLCR